MRWRFALLVGIAAVVPAGVAALLRGVVEENTVVALVLVGGYELLLLLSLSVGKVYKRLEQRWIERIADGIDAWLVGKLSTFERRYKEYVRALNRDVDVKGLPTVGMFSLGVSDVFVDLSLTPTPPHDASSDLLGGGRSIYGDFHGHIDGFSERRTIWHFLQARGEFGERLAIIGPPGAGKTTLLKHVAIELTERQRRLGSRHHLPFLLLLRDYSSTIVNKPDISLAEIIRLSLESLAGHEPKGWLEKRLEKGGCVLLLDGLDEVGRPIDRAAVVAWAERQMTHYSRNCFIVTSRPYGYRDNPVQSATVLRVRPFTEAQMEKFLDSWYRTIGIMSAGGRNDVGVERTARRGADELMGKLRENDSLYELAVNPLLLTMIAHVHYYRGALPGRRVELYREVCQVFLGRRQEAKGLSSDLSTDQKESVLQSLAFGLTTRREREFGDERARELLGPALSDVGSDETQTRDFVKYVEDSSGLLIEREAGRYAFAHLTIQEYLTAAHLKEAGTVTTLVENLRDEWWREVILLYAAQSDATPIVEKCLQEPASVYLLVLAEECAESARGLRQDVRRKLEVRIGNPVDGDRLSFGKIGLARKLRNVARVAEDVHVCREPVTVRDFEIFLRSVGESSLLYLPAGGGKPPYSDARTPVLGVSFESALAFARWVQTDVVPEWIFRLPSGRDSLRSNSTVAKLLDEISCWTMEGRVTGAERSVSRGDMVTALTIACLDTIQWHYPGALAVTVADQHLSIDSVVGDEDIWHDVRLAPLVDLAKGAGRLYKPLEPRVRFLHTNRLTASEEEAAALLDAIMVASDQVIFRPLTTVLDLLVAAHRFLQSDVITTLYPLDMTNVGNLCAGAVDRLRAILGVSEWPAEYGQNPAYSDGRFKVGLLLQEVCTLVVSAILEVDTMARRYEIWDRPTPRPEQLVDDSTFLKTAVADLGDTPAVASVYGLLLNCLAPCVLRYGYEKASIVSREGIILVRDSAAGSVTTSIDIPQEP